MIFSPFHIPGRSLRRPRRNGRYHARAYPGHTQVIDLHLERNSQNRTCRKARLLLQRGKVTTILRRHLIPVSQRYVIDINVYIYNERKMQTKCNTSLNDTNKLSKLWCYCSFCLNVYYLHGPIWIYMYKLLLN